MAISNFYRMDGWVKTTLGPAVSGAQIYVCTQPANVFPPTTPPNTTPVPWGGPTPQAQIYSDAGITPIVQPILTDGFGHYDFYVAPGLYTVVVLYNGTVQQFYVDQSIGNVGSSAGSSVLFETNGTPNFNQLVQNLVQGSGITISTDNLGNTTISASATPITLQTNGVNNGLQSKLNLFAGSNITLSDNGSGQITITSSASGPTFSIANAIDSDALLYSSTLNAWSNTFPEDFYFYSVINSAATPILTICPYGSLGTAGTGQINTASGGAISIKSVTATTPLGAIWTSTSGAGNPAGFYPSSGVNGVAVPIGHYRRARLHGGINQTTNSRNWLGLTAGQPSGFASTWNSDIPNIAIVGFRFSTAAGDTSWQCVAQVDNTHQSITPSGVSPDTNDHKFDIAYNGTTVFYYIDRVQVGSLSTNVPTVAILPFMVSFATTATTAALTFYKAQGLLRY